MQSPVSPRLRPRTLIEKQPYLIGYGFGISLISPTLTAYQLCKLYNKPVSPVRLASLSARIVPHQTALKVVQMNSATPVKEYLNPWLAFAAVGVLQGGVYGQCNVHFARVLKLSNNASMAGIFRGWIFAGFRDSISQGIPFVCSSMTEQYVFDPVWEITGLNGLGEMAGGVKRAVSVMCTSIFATVASQGLHNAQIKMQADQSLSYARTVQTLWAEHGASIFYKGASARIGLLLVVNGFNEVLLKPAWEGVPCDDEGQ